MPHSTTILFKFSPWYLLYSLIPSLSLPLTSLTPCPSFLPDSSPGPCTALPVNSPRTNYLCQNSREGHTVPQPRSFLATAKSSRFRGFRLVNSGATASFSRGSTSGFTSGFELVESAATPHPKNGNNQTDL